jgi:hypothetical protein
MATVYNSSQLSKKTAVINTNATTAAAKNRVSKLPSSKTVANVALTTTEVAIKTAGVAAVVAKTGVGTAGKNLAIAAVKSTALRLAVGAAVTNPVTGLIVGGAALLWAANNLRNNLNKDGITDNTDNVTKKTRTTPEPDSKWNLPPHEFSLPVNPRVVAGTRYASTMIGINDADEHMLRRGRIWFFNTAGSLSTVDKKKGTVTTVAEINKQNQTENKEKQAGTDDDAMDEQESYKYGFQFLWNPESISVSVARNQDVTPSAADRLRAVSGAFPGQETVSFSIVLDRINDFSMAYAHRRNEEFQTRSAKSPNLTTYDQFAPYYKSGFHANGSETFNYKMSNLMKYGTMADIEYLFKAINGDGKTKNSPNGWKTLLGKHSADIGYLRPTLMAVQIGPDENSISYVGWITQLSINHQYFNQMMIPLRSTLSISLDCFAGSTIV